MPRNSAELPQQPFQKLPVLGAGHPGSLSDQMLCFGQKAGVRYTVGYIMGLNHGIYHEY
jgi:hypothetical protein